MLHAARLAPKSDARVRPPVEDALPKVRPVVVREDAVVVARVEVPKTESRLLVTRLLDMDRFVAEALERVVFPATFKVEENVPVEPMSAP